MLLDDPEECILELIKGGEVVVHYGVTDRLETHFRLLLVQGWMGCQGFKVRNTSRHLIKACKQTRSEFSFDL